MFHPDDPYSRQLAREHNAEVEQQFADVEASEEKFENAVRDVMIDTANLNGDYFWEIMADFNHLKIDAARLDRNPDFHGACRALARCVVKAVVEA